MRPTAGTGCGLWRDLLPTPQASDGQGGAQQVDGMTITRPSGETYSARLWDVAASGLLPTPQTQGLKQCNADGKTEFVPTELLPTPTTTDWNTPLTTEKYQERKRKYADKGVNLQYGLRQMGKDGLLPTPRSNKVNGLDLNSKSLAGRNKDNLEEAIAKMIASQPTDGQPSQLNPLYVADMMGFPPCWTALPFLSGEKKA